MMERLTPEEVKKAKEKFTDRVEILDLCKYDEKEILLFFSEFCKEIGLTF